jgi:hypothetical protein
VAEALDCKLLLHQPLLLAIEAGKGHTQEPAKVLQLAL